MTVYLTSQYGTVMNPTGTQDDFLRNCFRSPTGKFIVTVTEHILTLFCLSTQELCVVDSMDVAAICDAAGGRFSHIEGTIDRVVWSSDESSMFVSTQDTLIGVVRITPNQEYVLSTSAEVDEEEIPVPRPELSPFRMDLDTVLVLPIREFFIAPSREFLIVLSRHSRLLLLVDWVNYAQKAKRFILPDTDEEGISGSQSPINSVLPMTSTDEDEIAPPDDSLTVVDAAVTDFGDALGVVYDSGIVRLFAISSPTFPISTVIACPAASAVNSCNEMVAIATKQAVYCYSVSNGTVYKLKWICMLSNVSTISSCSQGRMFTLTHDQGVTLVDEHGQTVFTYHDSAGFISSTISTWFKVLPVIRPRSPTVEFLSLGISASLLTSHTDEFRSQLIISRDSLCLFTFPSRQWRWIPVPALSEQGHIGTCAVQINPTSTYIVAVPVKGNGFVLWSAYTSPMVAAHKRAGVWEYFGDKTQEDKLGQIQIAGFVSETVFITKSELGDEIVLWSVLKRVDLDHAIARVPLASSGPIIASATKSSPRGYFATMYRGKIDLYFLRTNSAESYTLELVHKIVPDVPLGRMRISLVAGQQESTTTIIIMSNSDAYTINGTKIASNVSNIFSACSIGSQIKKDTLVRLTDVLESSIVENGDPVSPLKSPPATSFPIDDEDCSLCDRLLTDHALDKSAVPTRDSVAAIHRENPLIWFHNTNGALSLWVVVDHPEGNAVECIGRFSDETISNEDGGHSIIGISGQFGVMTIVDNLDVSRLSFASALHPLLLVLPSPFDSWLILKRLESGSPYLQLIMEVWLHCAITNALPILSSIDKSGEDFCPSSLTSKNISLCGHAIVSTVLTQLLRSLWVANHFASIFPATFAASVRKTEPHLMFPLTMGGSLLATPCEEIFAYCMHQKRCRDAALLLLILQDKFGPLHLREKFVAPLFNQAIAMRDYRLARDLASFHLSFERSSSLLISPSSRNGWAPVFSSNHSGLDDHQLRLLIEKLVLAHLNHLIVHLNDWSEVLQFSESLSLSLRDWLPFVNRVAEDDPEILLRLGRQFKSDFILTSQDLNSQPRDVDNAFDLLLDTFIYAKWTIHAKGLCIAFGRWDELEKIDNSIRKDTIEI